MTVGCHCDVLEPGRFRHMTAASHILAATIPQLMLCAQANC